MVPMFCGLFMWDYPYKNEITCVIHWMFVTWCNVVGWLLFCGGSVSDAVGGRGIGCRIGRTSPRSCFTGQGVAQSFFVGNVSPSASSSGCCGWCAKTHSNRNWLPVAELRNSLMKVLEPSTEVGFNQKCVLTWVVFVTEFECLSHGAMTLQDAARQCKTMQDNVRHCKTMQGDGRRCKMMQYDARGCKMMCYFQNNTKWRMLYTPSWYRAFLCHLRGILHNKMNYHVSYTASWYRAVLSHLCGNFHNKMKWHMSDMASCLWNTRDRQTNIFNICCISWGLCRGCPWDLQNCILIMPMFVCDVVDLCVMFSLICMSSGKKL